MKALLVDQLLPTQLVSVHSSPSCGTNQLTDFKHIPPSNKWACNLCTAVKKKRKSMSYREAIQHERNSADHISLVNAHSPQQEQPPQGSGWGQSSDPWGAQGPSIDAWFAAPVIDEFMTKEQLRSKEHQFYADHVDDMVPFWIRGIEAAERGEVLSLEEFLKSLETENWPPRGPDIWGHFDRQSNYGGRAENPWTRKDAKKWGAGSVSSASAESGSRTNRSDALRAVSHTPPSKYPSMRSPDSVVEVVARQKAVDDNRKQEMYTFLEVFIFRPSSSTALQSDVHSFQLPTNEKVKKIDDLIRTLRSS